MRIPAAEIEAAVFNRTRELALTPDLLGTIVEKANAKLLADIPVPKRQQRVLEKELKDVCRSADAVLGQLGEESLNGSQKFVQEKLAKLGEQRTQLEGGLIELEQLMAAANSERLSPQRVREALTQIERVIEGLPPYQRKKLVRMVLHRAELGENMLRLGFYGRTEDQRAIEAVVVGQETAIGLGFTQTSTWLPVCNPFHNRSLSPAVNRKPSISTGYQRSGRRR